MSKRILGNVGLVLLKILKIIKSVKFAAGILKNLMNGFALNVLSKTVLEAIDVICVKKELDLKNNKKLRKKKKFKNLITNLKKIKIKSLKKSEINGIRNKNI